MNSPGPRLHLTSILVLASVYCASLSLAAESDDLSTSPADSSLIASFLSLPKDELKPREKDAESLAKSGLASKNGPQRREYLAAAASQDPSCTHHWLALAETQMDMGYLVDAEISLTSARATIDFLKGDDRKEAIRDFSLAMGWFHFEWGNWEDGRKWGARAVKYKAGQEGVLVHNLNRAPLIRTFLDMKDACRGFRPLDSGTNRRANMSWCYAMHFYLRKYDFNETDAASWLRKNTHHYQKNATRWRDYGIYCEANQSERVAVKYFEKSHQDIRIKRGDWLTRMDHAIPPDSASPAVMPFWINPDQGYVTGSLLAYLGFLRDRMLFSDEPEDRQAWAKRIQANAVRADKRYPYRPWVLLWQSEALLALDQPWEAEEVIEIASAKFKALEISDANLDRVHGHILLLVNQPARADPMIRRAASNFPGDGSCMSDLGLIEVMAGNNAAALDAFDRAIELDPELTVVWYNRGLMKSHEGQFEEALADVQQAAILSPEDQKIAEFRMQLLNKIQLSKKR